MPTNEKKKKKKSKPRDKSSTDKKKKKYSRHGSRIEGQSVLGTQKNRKKKKKMVDDRASGWRLCRNKNRFADERRATLLSVRATKKNNDRSVTWSRRWQKKKVHTGGLGSMMRQGITGGTRIPRRDKNPAALKQVGRGCGRIAMR